MQPSNKEFKPSDILEYFLVTTCKIFYVTLVLVWTCARIVFIWVRDKMSNFDEKAVHLLVGEPEPDYVDVDETANKS